MGKLILDRRRFLARAGVGASLLTLGGCDVFDGMLDNDSAVRRFLTKANGLTDRAQRALQGPAPMAPEYPASAIRQGQRPNGSTDPDTDDYTALKSNEFRDYRLAVTGLVERPLPLGLDELQAMPSRTQITRHDCVEGWSCIAQWTGVPLSRLLDEARVKPAARYVVFRCFDAMDETPSGPAYYYESIDLLGARHPQTILAYGLNG